MYNNFYLPILLMFNFDFAADSMAVNPGKGPNEDNLKAILERTGYTLDVTTGQRKYGGPPPNWEGPPPGPGCEVNSCFVL